MLYRIALFTVVKADESFVFSVSPLCRFLKHKLPSIHATIVVPPRGEKLIFLLHFGLTFQEGRLELGCFFLVTKHETNPQNIDNHL